MQRAITVYDDENERQVRRSIKKYQARGEAVPIEILRNAEDMGIEVGGSAEPQLPFDDGQLTLEDLTVAELSAMAQDLEIEGRSGMKKSELIAAIRAS